MMLDEVGSRLHTLCWLDPSAAGIDSHKCPLHDLSPSSNFQIFDIIAVQSWDMLKLNANSAASASQSREFGVLTNQSRQPGLIVVLTTSQPKRVP